MMTYWNKIKKWLNKEDEIFLQDFAEARLDMGKESAKFHLHLHDFKVGELSFNDGKWSFKYSEEFKSRSNQLNLIIGFPDVHKTYVSQELWPFFKIRIPGLKQPLIREILHKENIEDTNQVKLLKRFGKKSISNPYELDTA
ncbi:HipA N-terminal domain-containing protein [Mongoliitalea lutea]|uniref:HipA N-terminal subdomain 1 domain-containing protein n=1 Tax=Mongoliitalea lutea TaxID=849756 RepID=A0A8J3G733_9BACT|nr:HipA N-terminal domain-containing protein [Mongoliitalea lutea]GHB52925.1 hypothetical protein GCM10008106_36890 [Mongoliitalea lutea]